MDYSKFFPRMFDPNTESGQSAAVSEREGDDIAREAYAEMEGTEPPLKKKEPVAEAAEPAKEQPATEEAEPPKKEDEAAAPKEEGVEPAQEGEPKADDAPAGTPALEEATIQTFAEKQKITFAEAKVELEAAQAVLSKYNNDPLEMARAYRSIQSAHDKLKAVADAPAATTPVLLSQGQLKAEINAYAEQNKDSIIEKYRTTHPKRTEMMEDEAVLEWAKDDAEKNYQAKAEGVVTKIKTDAAAKRENLVNKIPQADARFAHDIKTALSRVSDRDVLNPQYSVENLLWQAKGQRYEDDMKAQYNRGLKAGKEDPKVLGMKAQGPAGGTAKKPAGETKSGLSDKQKNQAYDMFPDSSPASAEKLFMEVYTEDLKKNKDFLPS